MNFLNRVTGLFTGPPQPNRELGQLTDGKLFYVSPTNLKTTRSCIYNDCVLSLRSSSSPSSPPDLVVTRVFDDSSLAHAQTDDEAGDDEERVFPLDERLFLQRGEVEGEWVYSWRDTDGDVGDTFQFVMAMGRTWDEAAKDRFDDVLAGLLGQEEGDSQVSESSQISERSQYRDAAQGEDDDEDDEQNNTSPPRIAAQTTPLRSVLRPSRSSHTTPASPSPVASPVRVPLKSSTPDTSVSVSDTSNFSDPEAADIAQLLADVHIAPTGASPSAKGKERETEKDEAFPEPVLESPSKAGATLNGEVKASLYAFDVEKETFVQHEKTKAAGVKAGVWTSADGREHLLTVIDAATSRVLTAQPLNAAMTFNEGQLSFFYVQTIPHVSNPDYVLSVTRLVRFASKADLEEMQHLVTRGMYDFLWGNGKYNKLSEAEQRWASDAYVEDVVMGDGMNEEGDEEEDEEVERELAGRQGQEGKQEAEESEEEEEEEEEDADTSAGSIQGPSSSRIKNSLLAVGNKEANLSFVVRGNMIGVFSQDREGGKKIKFTTSIKNLTTPDGKSTFAPSKVMLHDQDRTMVLANPQNPNSLYQLDLTTGKVVEEWKVSADNAISVSNFGPSSKYAQTTQEATLLGTSHNAIFRLDPRVSGAKLVDSQYKSYATKNDFSAIATTQSGAIAVASNKGEVRLYDTVGKIAKTALTGLGDPIVGIDASADGRWLVATSKTYLLLIDTSINQGKWKGENGFARSMPTDDRPRPRRLQLKPEHIQYLGGDVNFSKAHFNIGINEAEKSIITSTGKYVIAWNFRRVKAGHLDAYTIKKYADNVVADQFRFGGDRDIIVALPGDVRLADKSQLQKASRASMAPQYGGVVNEYRG